MSISVSQASTQLFSLIEQVNKDIKSVVIKSKAENAVLISQSEYETIVETAYLLSSPSNCEWLSESLAQAARGELFELVHPIHATKSAPMVTKKRK